MKYVVYVFYVESAQVAKIGYTSQTLAKRMNQTMYGNHPKYVTWDPSKGELIASVEFDTYREAKLSEAIAHDFLYDYRVKRAHQSAGGRCEWFYVSREAALQAFENMVKSQTVELTFTRQDLAKLRAGFRRSDASSLSEFIRRQIALGIKLLAVERSVS